MFTWIKRLAAPVAAVALLGFATAAQATTVSFYTVGYFTGVAAGGTTDLSGNTTTSLGSPSYYQDSTVTVNGAGAGVTSLSYHNNSEFYRDFAPGAPIPFSIDATTGPENANFGYFSALSGDAASLSGLGFTLEIRQLAPAASPSTGNLLGSFTGSFTTFGSTAVLSMNPNIVYIPDPATGVKYTVQPSDASITLNRFGPSALDGTVAVPLPAPVMAGLALLGGVFVARKFRSNDLVGGTAALA